MERTHRIDLNVYPYTVWFIQTDNIQQSREERNCTLGICSDLSGTEGLHSYHRNWPTSYIFLHFKAGVGTLVHECFHALYQMHEYIGATIENELFAYHLGYLVDEIDKFLKTEYEPVDQEGV